MTNLSHPTKIRPKERDAILQSLKAGVTPRSGLHLIQVGRVHEVESLIRDLNRIADGGSAFKLVIGDFGAGKSFFLQLIKNIAQEKGLVSVHADLSPDRRLHATGGQSRSLYAELMHNAATRSKPDGNAMASIVEKFITEARLKSDSSGKSVNSIIDTECEKITELVGGYDFAMVIKKYWQGFDEGNTALQHDAIRWLRAEYSLKTEARNALGVRTIIDDDTIYDHLKLMSLFVKLAGYKGLLVNLDELVNLYKLNNSKARQSNYEQILRILNDCLQGSASGIGFILGGTPDFLFDPRKGLFSYEALRSRLAENSFAKAVGVSDFTGPTLNLSNLGPEDLLILLKNIRRVFAAGDESKNLVNDDVLIAFLEHCSRIIGDSYFKTPRNTIKAFVDFLSVLEQNPQISWEAMIGKVNVEKELNSDLHFPDNTQTDDDDDLTNFSM